MSKVKNPPKERYTEASEKEAKAAIAAAEKKHAEIVKARRQQAFGDVQTTIKAHLEHWSQAQRTALGNLINPPKHSKESKATPSPTPPTPRPTPTPTPTATPAAKK